jgi:predicted nucleic acid-binding protein
VRLFLDTSVVLAACGSATGASRAVFDAADHQGWELQTSAYVLREVEGNLPALSPDTRHNWIGLRPKLRSVADIVSFDWVTVFAPAKDRPILFTAAAWSDVLLTLDRRDFAELLGNRFYGLSILKPGDFLRAERDASRFS